MRLWVYHHHVMRFKFQYRTSQKWTISKPGQWTLIYFQPHLQAQTRLVTINYIWCYILIPFGCSRPRRLSTVHLWGWATDFEKSCACMVRRRCNFDDKQFKTMANWDMASCFSHLPSMEINLRNTNYCCLVHWPRSTYAGFLKLDWCSVSYSRYQCHCLGMICTDI